MKVKHCGSLKRLFDILLSISSILILAPLFLCISAIVKLSSGGAVFYWSIRIGKGNKDFWMPKFRTMEEGTPQVATHLLVDSDQYLTRIGRFLRKTSLDELPQLWCILNGDMSFVGPRPALFNQQDLIILRTSNEIDKLKPGLTGLAQISGRDELTIEEKVKLDTQYRDSWSLLSDIKIIWLTVFRVLFQVDVKV